MKEKKAILLALDGGATKTTLTIRTTEGKCLFEDTTSGTNHQAIGNIAVAKVITDLLHDAYQSTQLSSIDIAVFAMAGIDTATDLETVTQIIGQCMQSTPIHIAEVIVENDVQSTLLGLVGHQPGALLISGSGSILFATDGLGKIVRTGGWGHRASDEGSGYWIGRQILKAIFKAEDGLDAPTILKKLVFEQLQMDSMDQLINWLYQPDYTNAQTASISSVLPAAAALNDEKAISISQCAAERLYVLVKATLIKLDYESKPFTLYLNGGILRHNPLVLKSLQRLIHQSYPLISLVLCEYKPIESIVQRAKYALY